MDTKLVTLIDEYKRNGNVIKNLKMKQRIKKFGDIVADMRKIKKVSQSVMAQEMVISLETLQKIETSEIDPDYDIVHRIADYFDVPPSLMVFFLLTKESMKDEGKKLWEIAYPFMEEMMYESLQKIKPVIDPNKSRNNVMAFFFS
jgi:transcriptional regulator with XRE-family HTH domain